MTRTRPFPYLFLMSGTRETSNSTGKFTGFRLAPVWPDIEQRSCHRASLVRENRSTPPIRRVTPGRDQERHVQVAFGFAHRKPQGNRIEKRRIRCRHLPCGKVVLDAESQFVADRKSVV